MRWRILVVWCASALQHSPPPRSSRAPPPTKSLAAWRRVVANVAVSTGIAAMVTMGGPVDSATAARPQNAASSAGSRVNKDAESLLRYGLPVSGPVSGDARKLQAAVESIRDDLRSKRVAAAIQDVETAKRLVASKGPTIAGGSAAFKTDIEAKLAEMTSELGPVAGELGAIGPPGSPQEREVLDDAEARQAAAAQLMTQIEARLVPPDFKATVPPEYGDLPRLGGRARVEFVFKKGPDAESTKFNIDGKLYDRARLEMIVDGYTAPLTSGNFLDLVKKNFYDGMQIQRADGFVVQTGDPDGPDGPLVGYGQRSASDTPRTVPLELHFKGDEAPTYGATSEDLGRGAAQTTLPFQSYGALGMARDEYDPDSASSQFFWLLFDSDLTPAGKNLLDGRYAAFGYTVKGEDFLADVAEGDIIESAKLIRAPPPFGDYTGVDP
ncbi:hypothetical protein CTAYLR_000283 [Chrysophaeum taylorii]|uniref:peptidylprolyl isomerase n=1 Tax=Chrysophaeum taylorii TaxID=2483200 RepID=A0AAD7UF39_9STRA|nr:hypothetical protein CTAYLR_000283 [Chrysophaeum taylorii]